MSKGKGGFATMAKEHRELFLALSRKGGKRTQSRHGEKVRWTVKEARAHGRQGGKARWNK